MQWPENNRSSKINSSLRTLTNNNMENQQNTRSHNLQGNLGRDKLSKASKSNNKQPRQDLGEKPNKTQISKINNWRKEELTKQSSSMVKMYFFLETM